MSSHVLEMKRRHELACEEALRASQPTQAARAAAKAAECAFKLAEKSEGDLTRAYLENARGWLEIAESLDKNPPQKATHREPADGKRKISSAGGTEDENENSSDWALSERPAVRFDDIIGMNELKQRIQRYLLKVKNPEEMQRWKGARQGDGLILFGPPGTGKTFFASAVAGELDAAFFDVKGSNLLSKWVGESQKNVARLFEELRRHERAVLFMDELDSVLSARGTTGSSVREGVISEFLQAMDGVRSNMKSLLFIGATNLPTALDPAIVSRVGALIYVGLPDAAMRNAYLDKSLGTMPDGLADDLDPAGLVERFERCSMRDMRRFIETLADIGLCRKLEGGSGAITCADVDQAWREAGIKPMSEKDLARYTRALESSS